MLSQTNGYYCKFKYKLVYKLITKILLICTIYIRLKSVWNYCSLRIDIYLTLHKTCNFEKLNKNLYKNKVILSVKNKYWYYIFNMIIYILRKQNKIYIFWHKNRLIRKLWNFYIKSANIKK